jgi:virginiamycin B lyase
VEDQLVDEAGRLRVSSCAGLRDSPDQMIVGPDNNLWFTGSNLTTDYIGRITLDGTITEFALPQGSRAGGLTVGPDAHIWFTDAGTDRIGCLVL